MRLRRGGSSWIGLSGEVVLEDGGIACEMVRYRCRGSRYTGVWRVGKDGKSI